MRNLLAEVPTLTGVDVLVVDDDDDARDMLAAVFEQAGARVALAASAAEALALFRRHVPTLLVSDIGMPDKDGCVLMREIRSLSPHEGGHVVAVAVTAYTSPSDRDRVLAAGFDLFVAKPVAVPELLNTLTALIGGASVT